MIGRFGLLKSHWIGGVPVFAHFFANNDVMPFCKMSEIACLMYRWKCLWLSILLWLYRKI